MTPDRTRGLIAAVAIALAGSLALLGACADGEKPPIGPDAQGPSLSHTDDGDADAESVVVVDGNISGDGEDICGQVNGTDQSWSGVKVDPAAEGTFEGFEVTLDKGGRRLDWREVGVNILKAAVLKAGEDTQIYYYNGDVPPDPAVESDDDLHGPDDKSDLSHYTLCHATVPTAIKVTLEDGGVAVPDRRVVAVSSDHGPYRDDHTLQSDVTDEDGVAIIDDLEQGGYCVRVTALAPTTTVIAPDDFRTAPKLASPLGTALSGDGVSVPLTRENFETYCINDPPLSPGDVVTLELQSLDEDERVSGTFGTENPEEMSAWMVVDVGSFLGSSTRDSFIDNLPSSLRGRVNEGRAKIGLFLTGASDDGTDATDFQDFSIPTHGGGAALEGDKLPVGDGFETVSASVSVTTIEGSLASEPLWCVSDSTNEPYDDGGSVEFGSSRDPTVNYGFLAEADLSAPLDPPGFGVTYDQSGGDAKLKLRAKTSKNTKRLVVSYSCEAGDCMIEKRSGALANRVDLDLGDTEVEDGLFRLRWIVTGLPKDTETVLFGLSAANDQFPNSAKDEDNDGLVDSPLPDSCETEGSTWILGAD